MAGTLIQDWTETDVMLKYGESRTVRYRVVRTNNKHYQQIVDLDDSPIHTLELPEGMKLDRGSYEVLLRYVLLDVVAA